MAKKKKPAKPKSLINAVAKVRSLQSEFDDLQARVDKLKRITGNREESAQARNARNQAMQKLAPLQAQLEAKGAQLQSAMQRQGGLVEQYSNKLANAGFEGAAQRFRNNAHTISQNAGLLGGKNAINKYTAGGSPGEKIQGIIGGGIGGLTGVVNELGGAAGNAGQQLVGMNLGEAQTGLFGSGGQQGLLGMLNKATGQLQGGQTAAQQQQIASIAGLSGDVRGALNQLSPEANLAIKQARGDSRQLQGIARGTGRMTDRMLQGQQKLGIQAFNQARNYNDPTQRNVRLMGREMMGAADAAGGLADMATNQAMNYVDPTAGLAQQAISGYQGLAGLQQGAAELAYERSGNLNPQQLRDSQQAAREAFASRGMAGTTGSVAAEILNREASLANRRAEAAQLGQIAQGGQQGLTALASSFESDRLGRAMGLQSQAAGLQGQASGMYGGAGQFMSGAESQRLNRRMGLQQNAGALGLSALGQQAGLRGEAAGASQNLYNMGTGFYGGMGLPLLTNATGAQQQGFGLLGSALGLSGQGAGLLQAGSNLGMGQYTNNLEMWNARRAADAAKDAAKMEMAGNIIQGGVKSVIPAPIP